MTASQPDYNKAQRHLARRDPVLKELIRRVGPCTLQPDSDHFSVLARSIVSQQISGKAATAISGRLVAALGKAGLTATALLQLDDEQMRGVGLSAPKRKALRDLATKVAAGTVLTPGLAERTDEEVIAHLLPVHGIGRWTAEMFLIFSLGRLDVLPVADYGLRVGVQRQYELAEIPKSAELLERGEPWRPYRSVATWYIWRSFGNVPQSE